MDSEYQVTNTRAEIETLEREIRYSRTKTLVELFVSSMFLLGVLATSAGFPVYNYSIRLISFFVIAFNVVSWMFWMKASLLYFLKYMRYNREIPDIDYESDVRVRYEKNLYALMSLKRVESIVNVLVGCQFIAFGIYLGLIVGIL